MTSSLKMFTWLNHLASYIYHIPIHRLINCLQLDFAIKDLGPLHFFLGNEAVLVANGLFLTQCRYIKDLLSRTKMTYAKPISSPMSCCLCLLW